MTMSVAPTSAWPPTGERRVSAAARPPEGASGADAAKRPTPPPRETASRDVVRNNEIAFDEKSGLRVVRTVDMASGEVVAQNPSEAYLRLAQAMLAALRPDDGEGIGADVLA